MEEAVCKAALAALDRALEVERQGKVFYEEAARHVQDPAGKAVFEALARDEVEHIRLLQAQYEKIESGQEWLALDEARVCEPQAPVRLFPQKKDVALTIGSKATDADALRLAMAFEEKGYQAYSQAQKETDDPTGKEVFAFLAKQENDPFVYLQKTLDYLTNQGAWYFDAEEFPMFDGG